MTRLSPRAWTILAALLLLWLYGAYETRGVDSDTGTPTSSPAVVLGEDAVGDTPAARPARASRSHRRHSLLNWHALAQCESSNNPKADTGNGYYGAYQFDLRTWRSVGGTGNPAHTTLTEQTRRAQRLYAARGGAPWPYCRRFL